MYYILYLSIFVENLRIGKLPAEKTKDEEAAVSSLLLLFSVEEDDGCFRSSVGT